MSVRGVKATTAETISYLYERPNEPIFNRKGGDGTVQLDIPQSYYTDRYKPIIESISTRGSPASVNIQIKQLAALPDISLPMTMPLRENFSVFSEYHRSCANRLIEILLQAKTVEDFISTAAYIHDRVNSYLYIYALSVALLNRSDTRNIPLPSHVQSFPELYMDRAIFSQAREEENIVPDGSRVPIDIPRDYTASDLDLEHRVSYFREDVGINLHHWHWHLVYPLDGRLEIVRKDRRGELFYYMHEQILARYNMERLCNQLARVKRFVDFRSPIEEAYFPKLDSLVASRIWPPRQANAYWDNLNRENEQVKVDIQDLERWRDRIYEAIHTGRYLVPGSSEPVLFTVETGIDILGNMIESSILSVNRTEYGNLHNMGHLMIAYIHDPENRYLETFGIMGDTSTAMRDPFFYRWHSFINDIFEQYKSTLPPYTVQQIQFESVRVTGVQITSNGIPNNQIATFWQQAEIDLSRGLDFAESRGAVFARVTHLQHAPFVYNITVRNDGAARMGTVRIFYGPKFDERGTPFLFRHQKSLFVELDRFTVNLQRGNNTLTRRSELSSVTIPYEQTFRNLANRPATGTTQEEGFNFCGCGWPQHMLICKGTPGGYPCDLFVMVSDNRNDTVSGASASTPGCDDASSYCGVRDSRYPDRQSMGFPFDRMPREGVTTLRQFVTENMGVQDIQIVFHDRVVAPIQRTTAATAQPPARRN